MPVAPRAVARLLPALASAAACDPGTGPWDTYTAAVLYKRNHPLSVAAKGALQRLFCARFGVSPCAPAADAAGDALHIARDLDIHLPKANFTDVVIWLQQNRKGLVSGSGYDVDVMVYPNTACPGTDLTRAVHIGHRYPLNTNALPAPPAMFPPLRAAPAPPPPSPRVRGEDDSEFTQCSSDATCYPPFANNTGCTGDANVGSFHFHFYYVANDASGVAAANAYIDATQTKFGLDTDVCADNNGHEQPHDATCWLSGPGGSGPLPRPNNVSHQGPGGSFNFPVFSLYVTRADFVNVLSWTMAMKTAAGNGAGELDFLVHPNCGCNFADHVYFGLHATTYIPANKQGCAEEAGWYETYAPAIDPDAMDYPGNYPVDGCGLQDGEKEFATWEMHVLYSPASKGGKDSFVAGLAAAAAVSVGVDAPYAYADPASIALTSEHTVRINASAVAAAVPWALANRPDGVDLILAPLSAKGAPCRYTDYVSRATYAGERWEVNEHAAQAAADAFRPAAAPPAAAPPAPRAAAGQCAFPPRAYVLYMMAAEPNGYQMYAAGLDSYQQGMAQAFITAFGAQDCTSQYPTPEPSYGDDVCSMGVRTQPYMSDADPLTVSYAAAYVPPARLSEVLSWAADNRVAGKHYYNVDIRLVPLTGCARDDFTRSALKAGDDWRLNLSPLSA